MKVNQKPRTMMFPAPAVVAAAYDEDGKADCCTLAFATMCSHRPPAVMIAINTTLKRKTLKSILHSKEFTVAFPSVEHVAETDYIGIVSGYDTDKLADVGFTFKNVEMVNAPIINEYKVSLECKVMHIANEKGRISFEKLNPLGYDDVSHTYFEIGEPTERAFKIGLKFKK